MHRQSLMSQIELSLVWQNFLATSDQIFIKTFNSFDCFK